MVDYDNVCFNIAAFIAGLFVLEFGADKFVDHTAIVASRLNVPSTLIALLTAGAEWEELVVVVAAISQSQSSLAMGNILGSSISNILGAFSLGLIFTPETISFDRSSKIYTAVLLALTSFFVLIVLFESLSRAGGVVLVATFFIYVASIAWAIYKGIVTPPEDDPDSDNDGNSDPNSDSDSDNEESGLEHNEKRDSTIDPNSRRSSCSNMINLHDRVSPSPQNQESAPLDPDAFASDMFDETSLKALPQSNLKTQRKQPHSTLYHIAHLTLGLLALSLSGYVLSHSISTIANAFSFSSTVLGITFLSFATTLPEKLIAIFSGSRQEGGIMIANTVGSNIFLVTLCAGVLFLAGDLQALKGSVTSFEIFAMWVSSLVLFGVVTIGGRKWIGWMMFALYIAFIILELTVGGR